MRPLVYRGTFQGLTGRFLVWLVNALEVPDLEVASVRARTMADPDFVCRRPDASGFSSLSKVPAALCRKKPKMRSLCLLATGRSGRVNGAAWFFAAVPTV
jgi:hypothetical protein